jgi:hypothetical protein
MLIPGSFVLVLLLFGSVGLGLRHLLPGARSLDPQAANSSKDTIVSAFESSVQQVYQLKPSQNDDVDMNASVWQEKQATGLGTLKLTKRVRVVVGRKRTPRLLAVHCHGSKHKSNGGNAI